MKRYRFIVLFAVFTLLSFTSSLAQNRFYLACNFYALNGTCFNQPPSWYAQTETDGYSPEQIEHFTNQFITDYPNYPVVAPASNLYNCHGFAYSVFQGGEIPENAVQPGDIATIIDPDDNGTYSIHSSIVLNQDTLISKLGNYPVFKHHKYDPWIVSITNLGPSRHYVYYRRIINTQLTGPDIIDEPPPTSPIRPPSLIWLPRLGSPLHFPIPATTIIPSRRKSTCSFPPQPSRKSPSPTGSSSTPTPLLRCQGRYYSCKTRGLSLSLLQSEILTIKTRTT